MVRYVNEQWLLVLKIYFKYYESLAETIRRMHAIFARRNPPNCLIDRKI